MGNKNPNGNVIVDADGHYNPFDGGVRKDRFDEIKRYYVIGDENECGFLTEDQIRQFAPAFVSVLNDIFGTRKDSVWGIIGRGGRKMTEEQTNRLLTWLRN